jgi:hypothetical protein
MDRTEIVEACREAIRAETGAADAIALRRAVLNASVDMHHASDRPCGTCEAVSKALREPWGCYAYHKRRGQPVPKF